MDIEKAIKSLENIKEYWSYKPTEVEAAELAIQALEKQLNDKWIPVSERLPNEEELKKFKGLHPNRGKFICTIQVLDLEPQVRSIYYDRLLGWLYEGENYNEYVIVWKPLPEVYRETTNED